MTKTKEQLREDIKIARSKNFFNRIEKFYRKLPETECSGCGKCCYDTPVVYYIEFMYVFELFDTYEESTKINVLDAALSAFLYGLIDKTHKCAFLDDNNRCMIYSRSPISCKRWGLHSKEENENDWNNDFEHNKKIKDFYKKEGIEISDEVINWRLPYCNNVIITNNPYRINESDFTEYIHDLVKVERKYIDGKVKEWTIIEYLIYCLMGIEMYNKRIELVKKYQNGEADVIENFIKEQDIKSLIS